jgi:hypothetical protein
LRYVRSNLFTFITVAPFPDKAFDAIIAARKTLTLQFFKEYLCRALFPLWFGAVRRKTFLQKCMKRAELRERLFFTDVMLVGDAASEYLLDGVAGKLEINGNLAN